VLNTCEAKSLPTASSFQDGNTTRRTNLEISTSVSIEIGTKQNIVTLAGNVEILAKPKGFREDVKCKTNNEQGNGLQNLMKSKVFSKLEKKFESSNNANINLNKETHRFLNKGSINKFANEKYTERDSFFDFKEQVFNNLKDMNINNLSMSIDKPFLPAFIEAGNGELFDSDGYMEEEDDEDTYEKNTSTDLILFTKEEDRKPLAENNKVDRLIQVLYGNTTNMQDRYSLLVDRQKGVNKSEIIKAEQFLNILKCFYEELNPTLIELSDNFTEERRKYFEYDTEKYIEIIENYLEEKDEFFVCVMSNIMSKLNISQELLDNSFHYYLYQAEPKERFIGLIRESYRKIYNAGVK
jgi:hypothetical protein